ncbi:hypothetical protein ACFWNG_04950 [Streptomyces sp. NPDC058391]|uniref:hypothetical protein n=1 Tax=Streptomyces sp. NPDC058391 TaxID=3346476 RepID=UPI0036605988
MIRNDLRVGNNSAVTVAMVASRRNIAMISSASTDWPTLFIPEGWIVWPLLKCDNFAKIDL